MISIIACIDQAGGIGLNGDIPWSLPPDMKHFRSLTLNNVIVMGRKTWESIGSKPLPRRVNIVITSNPDQIKGTAVACTSVDAALAIANKYKKKIFIIGGHGIYKEALEYASIIHLTRIDQSFNCDTFFPLDSMSGFKCESGEWQEHNDLTYRFETHKRIYSESE